MLFIALVVIAILSESFRLPRRLKPLFRRTNTIFPEINGPVVSGLVCRILRTKASAGPRSSEGCLGWKPRSTKNLLPRRQEIPEHCRQLFGETARFGDGFELPVGILRIPLLPSADTAYDDHVTLGINSVNDAVVAKLMLPIPGQRAPQR